MCCGDVKRSASRGLTASEKAELRARPHTPTYVVGE